MSEVITQRQLRNDSGEIMRRLRFVPVESITHLFQGAPSVNGESFRRDLDAHTDQRTELRS